MFPHKTFQPVRLLKNAFLQTVLASSRIPVPGKNPITLSTRQLILKTREGVRLTAHYSPQINGPSRGLVILLV
jgi:uncharacterized protein